MSRPAVKPCGTRAAWLRHRKNGETPCEACREAAARENRERRAAKARKIVRCQGCNCRTESKVGFCPECMDKYRSEIEDQENALTGGRWVPRGGVQIWVQVAA